MSQQTSEAEDNDEEDGGAGSDVSARISFDTNSAVPKCCMLHCRCQHRLRRTLFGMQLLRDFMMLCSPWSLSRHPQ